MTQYSIELTKREYMKWFLSFAINFFNKHKKRVLDMGINASKKVVPKADNF